MRREQEECSSDVDFDQQEANAKKIRIERMVHMKRLDEERAKAGELGTKDQEKEEENGEIEEKTEKDLNEEISKSEEVDQCNWGTVKAEETAANDGDTSSEPESPLSDEDAMSTLQLDLLDDEETQKVRIL